MKLPERIHLDVKSSKLFVDGDEFPYPIAEHGVTVSGGLDEMPRVTVDLFAESVEVTL